MHPMWWDFGQVGMDRSGSLATMGGGVNDGFWPIGDVAGSEDARSAGSERCLIDEQTTPGSDADAGSLR